MSHDINSRLLKKIKPCINTAIHMHTCFLYMAFTYARYQAPHKAHAYNEKLKSARNEHKNESFYAYENVIEAVKYSAPLFLSFQHNLMQ